MFVLQRFIWASMHKLEDDLGLLTSAFGLLSQ